MCELAKRLYQASADMPPVIRTPQDAVNRLADMRHLQQEEFRVLMLNSKNAILAERTISRGTVNATVVTPREVFHRAVKVMAAAVILAHNHPSGDPAPSLEDIELTKTMVQAGAIMSITVLDHVIIGQGNYVSLKEKGAM